MIDVTCDYCGEYISVSQASERIALHGRSLDLHGQCVSQIDAFIGDHYKTAKAPRDKEREDFRNWRFERERMIARQQPLANANTDAVVVREVPA